MPDCVREGLTPQDDGTLLVDCVEHGAVGFIEAGPDEYGRAERLFQLHVEQVTAPARERCPDGGKCHHACRSACFRVLNAEPLSGVYPRDEWPYEVRAEESARATPISAKVALEVEKADNRRRQQENLDAAIVSAYRQITFALTEARDLHGRDHETAHALNAALQLVGLSKRWNRWS